VPEVPEEREPGADAVLPPRRRRGLRATLLVVGAAVLGVVGGTCTGYLVQADREPTALPPLSQPVVKQSKGEVVKASAAHDNRVKTDGDLRDLLLKKPSGYRDLSGDVADDGWMDLETYADQFDGATSVWESAATDEFRRAASAEWKSNTAVVEINLLQFRQVENMAAMHEASNEVAWADEEPNSDGWPIPGTGDGMAYVHHTSKADSGYMPLYFAEAYAWRGDVEMQVWIYDTKPVSKEEIIDLAKRQAARL
jgi:hypothetical protein